MKSLRSVMTALAAPAVLACALAASSGAAAPHKPFKVASTLDGKTVLPHRIRWRGLPTLPAGKISEVDFLIDGKVRWVEREVPYSYSEDDGYLVTSWLKAGRHTFAVRAVATDGRKAIDKVTARVLPAAQPSAALAGSWQRTINDMSGAPRPGSAGNPTDTFTPTGTYTIVFDKRWIENRFPGTFDPDISQNTGAGWITNTDWLPSATTFRAQGAVAYQMFHDSDQIGGSWCNWDGPVADYSWSVSGDTLTLAPIGGTDACGIRGFVWTGQWTRTG